MEYSKLSKKDKKRFDVLLQRVNDIYSGAVGRGWSDDYCTVGAEEIAMIAPAIIDRLYADAPKSVGYWLSHLGTPESCAEWLWTIKYWNSENNVYDQ